MFIKFLFIDQKYNTVGKLYPWTTNMQLLKIHWFAILIIIVISYSRSGKTNAGTKFSVNQPYRQIITYLKMPRCLNWFIRNQGRKQIVVHKKKRKDRLTIENSAYIRSMNKKILLSKRSVGCLRQCLGVG